MKPSIAFALAGVIVMAMILVLTGVFMMASRQAQAMAACGQQTGLPCGECHTDSAGGGKLTDFGEEFKANGNKLPER